MPHGSYTSSRSIRQSAPAIDAVAKDDLKLTSRLQIARRRWESEAGYKLEIPG
jgi:hypothetical protein